MSTTLTAFLSSTALVDVILGLMAIEVATLAAFHRRTGRGLALPQLAATTLSGALLLLALRSVLAGHAALMPVWLSAAFLAHLADLAVRWER